MSGIEFWVPLALILLLLPPIAIVGAILVLRRPPTTVNAVATPSPVVNEMIEAYDRASTENDMSVGAREFAAMVLFWNEPCLDTTFYALSALRRLLVHADRVRAQYLIEGMADRLKDMLRTHFDDDGAGAFRHHRRSWPTLYASVIGARLSGWCVDPASFARLDSDDGLSYADAMRDCLGSESVDKLTRFLAKCELKEGGFAEFPGAKPGTVTTDAGYRLLAMLGKEPRYCSATADFIWRCCKEEDQQHDASTAPFGFANRPDDDHPTCAATRHATRALEENPTLREIRGLDNEGRSRVCDFLKLLRAQDGGFAWTKGASSSVVQTGLAFQTLKLLVTPLGGTYEDVVPYESISDYLKLLASGTLRFGFRSSSPDNVCAVREAVRLTDVTERAYDRGLNGLGTSLRGKLLQAVCDHFDERTGMFVGYAQDGHKSVRSVAKYLGRSILDLPQPALAATS